MNEGLRVNDLGPKAASTWFVRTASPPKEGVLDETTDTTFSETGSEITERLPNATQTEIPSPIRIRVRISFPPSKRNSADSKLGPLPEGF
jgi:hypothetical protein